VKALTTDGRAPQLLTIGMSRKLISGDAQDRLTELFVMSGVPESIGNDNGSEFAATGVREWLRRVWVKTLCIESGSPRENGYNESFNGKLGDELLNVEILDTLLEAKALGEMAAALAHDPAAQRVGIPSSCPTGGLPEAFLERGLGGATTEITNNQSRTMNGSRSTVKVSSRKEQ
jgi:transposase InsO family protein